jgi:hypothetical protein
MRIKDPTLVYKTCTAQYDIDVEGTKVRAYYTYNSEHEMNGGWEYDLSPCFKDLDEDEIRELEDEFCNVIYDISV